MPFRIGKCITEVSLLLALGTLSCQAGQIEEFDLELPGHANVDARDWEGLKRDTWYFLGYQWVTIGVLYMAPESVSSWTDEQKEGYDLSYWWDNVTHPEIDSDKFYLNYVLHPYWGAAYYVRAQERGYGPRESFWYSAMLSTIYEFGAEALFEEPSIQDLIVTPVGGALLGGYFMKLRRNIRDREDERGYRTTGDKWVWVLTDPLGSLNRQVDRLFGRNTRGDIRPSRYVPRIDPVWPNRTAGGDDGVYVLDSRLRW